MYNSVVLFISIRYIFKKKINQFNKYVYWIFSISITLSVSIIIIILSVMNGFECKLKNGLLYLTPHIIITASKGYTHVDNVPDFISGSMFNDIKYIKPVVISNAILQSSRKISVGTILGVDPNYFEPLSNYLINNKIDQLLSEKFFIIIGSDLAQQLSVNINDYIRVIIPSIDQITPIGYLPTQRLFTVSDIYISKQAFHDHQVLIHQYDASKLMHYPAQCISGWRIWLHEPLKISKFDQLAKSQDWVWKDWREYHEPLFQAIKIEKITMFLLFILIIVISGLNIISLLILSITEKQKEIAVLKTHGLKKFQIIIIFILQSISYGIFGMTWGISLGILVSNKLNDMLFFMNILPKTVQLPVEIQYFQIFNINIIFFLFIIFMTLYPSWKIASICPAKVLKYD